MKVLIACEESRHAPRERVSWNTQILFDFCHCQSHAPRERVSWNNDLVKDLVCCVRHAPRERVSWNNSVGMGTLFFFGRNVWSINTLFYIYSMSRSTWACELKFCTLWSWCYIVPVTLHVSVWVEMPRLPVITTTCPVTLHVSVWVEIVWPCRCLTTLNRHAPRERVSWNAHC